MAHTPLLINLKILPEDKIFMLSNDNPFAETAIEAKTKLREYVIDLCDHILAVGVEVRDNGHLRLKPDIRGAFLEAKTIAAFINRNDPRQNPAAYEAAVDAMEAHRFNEKRDLTFRLFSDDKNYVDLAASKFAAYAP